MTSDTNPPAPTLDHCAAAIAELLWRQFCPDIAKGTTPVEVYMPLACEAARACIGAQWQPIETAPKGKKIIVGYPNGLGNWRTVTACYYPANTLACEDDLDGYAPEGWYEESDSREDILPTSYDPTHWMPLPKPPTAVLEGRV